MKRISSCFLLVTILGILAACSNVQRQSVEANPYDGRVLSIGIIGESPKILEEQVTFLKIQFSDLEKEAFNSQYDAIFITKDNLFEAAQGKYASIYKESKIPLFFIQTEKSYVPFTEEDLSYEEAEDISDQTYATGIMYRDNKLKYWGYGLYNDIKNQENIKDVYSRIFETISQNKMPK
ncbi:transcription elongation factor GreAB [Oceanirhabdus seepicola]|uniref:Transcription elongation factor GreAB n=1 Tax=Oceanirhabdus seepicola TaxID=2828781 RepID=A0A9J6P531_9CLOT|nr:transcription elongation factor GreAB [Oceanirhabdus seepicola]MCM1991348.1 transcription elongation factor GreAB [Oceanirhabdus seepicola]